MKMMLVLCLCCRYVFKLPVYEWVHTTELDREYPDFPPYLIRRGQKIGSSRVLLAMRSEVADCVCGALQVWGVQCGCNISALEVTKSYLVSLRALFGKDLTQPNFCSIADGAIIRDGIGSTGSPYQILWSTHTTSQIQRHKHGKCIPFMWCHYKVLVRQED